MLEQLEASGSYCCDTVSTSAITTSVSSTFLATSAASVFKVSRWLRILSSSKILPLTSFKACNSDFKLPQTELEFTLQFQQIRPLLIYIWSFSLQHLVQTLTL
uniref:Uncharacterized protein n=1 Tax=Arion vulgaris TaxID=1028688 RepID=A0A0B7BLA7_9EUPU